MMQGEIDIGELLMHHTADAYAIDFGFHIGHTPMKIEWHSWPWAEFTLFGVHFNLTPTKHVIFMLVAATLLFLCMWLTGRILERQRAGEKAPKGFANAMEAFVLWVRRDIVISNIGEHDGPRFAPYIMTLFFFILISNILGLLPWGATATGNLGVTAALAIMALFTIELSGLFKLGVKGYMRTIFPSLPGMGGVGGLVMSVAMGPIEILGKLVKPFALCFRLFGNMTAGHFVILTLFGLIFMFGNIAGLNWAVGVASATLVLGVMCLEIIVAFVQAYVFAIITAVLIGMMMHEH
jgi:F-type H+-transporting ATPase subunit a